MALYNCIYDPKQTQFGFALKYFPRSALSPEMRRWIGWSKLDTLTKDDLEFLLNPEKTHLEGYGDRWEIVWRNNATPTHLEYSRWPDDQKIQIELRSTNLHGKVAILNRVVCITSQAEDAPHSTHPY